jgi:hypothetical protein
MPERVSDADDVPTIAGFRCAVIICWRAGRVAACRKSKFRHGDASARNGHVGSRS